MASIVAPVTSGLSTPSPQFRRSFTLPPKLPDAHRSRSYGKEADRNAVEILFAHHTGRIVSFSSGEIYSRSRSGSLAKAGGETGPVGSLPWASVTEKTLAAGKHLIFPKEQSGSLLKHKSSGPLSFYRVRDNDVAFLSSGRTLQPILPKSSQFWCVDGETKFVLRIRENYYYRIELPNNTTEDRQIADELKEVLPRFSQYERTECPFKRGFTVQLPDSPKTPTQKRPWTPRTRPRPLAEMSSSRDMGQEFTESRLEDVGEHVFEDVIQDDRFEPTTLTMSSSEDIKDPFDELKTPTRPKGLVGCRAVTAPPQLTLKLSPPSNSTETLSRTARQDIETASIASSVDSFHSFRSFHSPISPLPPSPPYSDPPSPPQRLDFDLGIKVPLSQQHKRDNSEITVTVSAFSASSNPSSPRWPRVSSPSTPVDPQTPALTNDAASQNSDMWPEVATPSPRTALRCRRRAYSPLPPPANLYSPQARLSGHHLTNAILQKTCSLLLGPPIQLVALMLNIARKIANGAFHTNTGSYAEGSHSAPGTWESSDAEVSEEEIWEEDDYGIALREVPSRTGRPTTAEGDKERSIGGSWEID
ncbi:hypothetical protein MMC13_000275 [Lambiella insularis]|nr:hypothetical protein [Lambiella insularis]